ncbi:MAG: hypothetical protein RR440_00395 [Erysipelotrichaceae bacterium]
MNCLFRWNDKSESTYAGNKVIYDAKVDVDPFSAFKLYVESPCTVLLNHIEELKIDTYANFVFATDTHVQIVEPDVNYYTEFTYEKEIY